MAFLDFVGSGPPTSTPTSLNQFYQDTASKEIYFSTGTSSSTDWKILQSGSFTGTPTYLHTITGPEIAASQLTLPSAPPTAADVRVTILGGPMQGNGIDFTVSGSVISWLALGMATVVSSGDVLVIEF